MMPKMTAALNDDARDTMTCSLLALRTANARPVIQEVPLQSTTRGSTRNAGETPRACPSSKETEEQVGRRDKR